MSGVRLSVLVFVAGCATLATEISASRLLAPYFGSSTIVWANIIGLILIYLSIGYWLGGKLADRYPEPRLLGLLVLVAAVVIAATPFIARPILDLAVKGLDAATVGAVVGSFFAALALFAIPVTLLGAVSPFAIRLSISDVEQAGTVAGRLYALSTVGSIVGTFLSALVTIPLLGTQRTMLGAAALLVFGAALLLGRRWQLVTLVFLALLLDPGRRRQGDAGAALRNGIPLSVRPGGRAGRQVARAEAERGRGRPLALAAGLRLDRRGMGHVPHGAAASGRAGAAHVRDRKRGRNDRACLRCALP